MPREVFGRDFAFLPREELLRFEEIARRGGRDGARSASARCASRAASRCCGASSSASWRCSRRFDGIEDIALTTNGLLLARSAQAPARRGPGPRHRQPRRARRATRSRAMSGRDVAPARVLAGIDAAREAGLVAGEGQHGRAARAQRPLRAGDGRALPQPQRRSCASSSTWTSARPTAGARGGGPSAPRSSRAIDDALAAGAAARRRAPGEVATRYRYLDGAGEIGLIHSVSAAVLRRLHARAAVGRRQALHLPVRAPRARPARAAAGGAGDERARRARGRRSGRARADRYSAERALRAARASPARGSRCPTSAAEPPRNPCEVNQKGSPTMAKVLCVLYDDPVDGYPPAYARDDAARDRALPRRADRCRRPRPSTSRRASCSAASRASSACGRSWRASGHTLVVTSDKDGPDSVFERELRDADVVISQPFWPAYLTAERIAKAPQAEARHHRRHRLRPRRPAGGHRARPHGRRGHLLATASASPSTW